MDNLSTDIRPVRFRDLIKITRMTFKNMAGVDRHFSQATRNPLWRMTHFLKMPLYLAYAGMGYKAVRNGEIIGCAYVHLRRVSAYIFNVSVNQPYRQQGVASLLMVEIEKIAQENGRQWLALQVDDGNHPAQRLYQRLGYRVYHPLYYHKYGNIPRAGEASAGIELESIPQYPGERLFHRYQRTEIMSGDPWAVQPLVDYETIPRSRWQFYRCLLHGREIGCAMLSHKYQRLHIWLVSQPDYWGDASTGHLIRLLADRYGGSPMEFDIYLGSSAHHRAATALLNQLGFQTRTQWRMLMFKEIGK